MNCRTFLLLTLGAVAAAQPGLPNLAAGVMDQTRQAQQAVAARDSAAANDHVKRALATVAMIEQNAPPERPILIPIFQEVETETTVTPVKKHAELDKRSSIRGVEGDATTTRLDVTAAGERLRTAQTALAAGDWAGAQAALAAVESSVSTSKSTGAMPLEMARQNLQLARTRVLEGKFHDAELPLKSAAQALGDYEKGMTGAQAAEVESARQAMAGYASRVEHEHDDAAGRIDGWMQMMRRWSGQ